MARMGRWAAMVRAGRWAAMARMGRWAAMARMGRWVAMVRAGRWAARARISFPIRYARAVISSHLLELRRAVGCQVRDAIVPIKYQVAHFSLVSNVDQCMHSPVSIFGPIRSYFP